MWARVIEIMLGFWLAASPFIFRHPEEWTGAWARDFAGAFLVVLFACLSFWRPARKAHLGILAVAGWLILAGFSGSDPSAAALQNDLCVGAVLAMLAIIPTTPVPDWRTERAAARFRAG